MARAAQAKSRWPEGLTDKEAIDRLRSVALLACDGARDVANDRQYKAIRTAMRRHPILRGMVPGPITSASNLTFFCEHLKGVSPRRADRREYVMELLAPLVQFTQTIDVESLIPSDEKTHSDSWTGRPSAFRQAEVVRALAPAAMAAVERLIEDQERILDNGGPVDSHQREAIEMLRELHIELGKLIRLAEAELPLNEQLGKLAAVKDRTFKSLAENLKLDASALAISASALGVALTVIGAVELFTGSHVASLALGTMSGAVHGQARANDRKSKAPA